MVTYPFRSPSGTMLNVTPNSTLIPYTYFPVNPGSYKIKIGDSKSLSTRFITIQAGQPVLNPYKNFLVSVSAPAANIPTTPPSPDPQPAQTSSNPDSAASLPPSPNDPPPAAKTVYSNGNNYVTTSGATIYLAVGTAVPPGWVVETTESAPTDDPTIVPFINAAGTPLNVKLTKTEIPPGYKPLNPGSYQYKQWDVAGFSFTIFTANEQTAPADSQPNGPCYLLNYKYSAIPNQNVPDIPINKADTIFTPDEVAAGTAAQNEADAISQQVADNSASNSLFPSSIRGPGQQGAGQKRPSSDGTTSGGTDSGDSGTITPSEPSSQPFTINWTMVGSIIGVIGVAGVSYVGYLYLTNPTGFKNYAERLHSLIGIGIDLGYFTILLAIIVGISFISYEFFNAYSQTGTVAGALGKLTVDVIEVLVSAIVDAVETIVSDAVSFVGGEVKSVIPSWMQWFLPSSS